MVSFILPTIFMIILNISIFQTVQDSRHPRLLPLPLTSQSSTGTTVSSTQGGSTCLRIHRGGGSGGAGNRNKNNNKNSSRSSSMRSRNNKNVRYPSLRGHSNSFRHYYNDSGSTKEQMYVTMHRKRSSSISTLTNLPKIETLNNEIKDGWIPATEITQTDITPVIVKTKKFEPIELRSNKYFSQHGIIEKSARSAIWYPAILAAFVAEKKPRKYSQRMIFYPPINKSRQSLRTELRVARTIAIVVACFSAFQTCPIDKCIPGWLFTIAFWLGYANSAVNPLLYAAVSRDFRSAFRKYLIGKGSKFHSRFSSAHRSS
uniref:G-protein coupled receptors family 1 profile domain-containing protein n=1 Tax=Panagrolaimus sp. ES5 TaxID=591445 RepID=A0AC34F347_9BILA